MTDQQRFVVVDIQQCYGDEIKELAYYKNGIIQSFLFKPRTPSHQLSSYGRFQNKWLEKNLHNLDYEYGTHDFEKNRKQICEDICDTEIVLAKGFVKCLRLEELLLVPVIDLDNLGCPQYRLLSDFAGECSNVGTTSKHKLGQFCAEKKARVFAYWYEHYLVSQLVAENLHFVDTPDFDDTEDDFAKLSLTLNE